LLTHMTIFLNDAAIQAYGCDALGRLASEPQNQISIASESGVDAALCSMKEHPMHPGVQDRACFLLLAMTEYPPAVVTMREKEALTIVREARGKIPPKEIAKQRLESLISRLEKEEGSSWFGRKNAVTP
jgi:glucose-6-phosphate dehydrogenase assembly protein OpcA